MAKFRKNEAKEVPAISTGSMPDIIFMSIFFFMVTTSMRETTLKVKVKLPEATEVQKLEKKSLVSYIYIGPPTKEYRGKLGTGSRIQLNEDFAEVDAIHEYIIQERENMQERDKPFMKVSLKMDQETQMGIVTDVKMALREAWALNINYSATKRQ